MTHNLEMLGVHEMSTQEVREVEGGSFLLVAAVIVVGVGIGIGIAYLTKD